MSDPGYFRKRRRLLARRGLCVRCGSFPPADGHKLCAYCLEIQKLKRPDRTAATNGKRAKRLAEIEEIRRRLMASELA